nr:MAG TPA: hypothetical protein [Caudoviricetes sp.]
MESLFGSFMKPSTTNKLYVVRVPVSYGALVLNEDVRCFCIDKSAVENFEFAFQKRSNVQSGHFKQLSNKQRP